MISSVNTVALKAPNGGMCTFYVNSLFLIGFLFLIGTLSSKGLLATGGILSANSLLPLFGKL